MPFRIVLLLAIVCFAISGIAQQPAPTNGSVAVSPLQAMVDTNFGDGFAIDPKFKPLMADFDLDGAEDLAVVAFGKTPMANALDHDFRVIDPYDSYFGFGDARLTTKFSDFGDGTSHCVLMIHDWHGAKPKAKFVIVNLPFEQLSLTKTAVKKKSVAALSAVELGGLSSVVYWDGKKYKWEATELEADTKLLNAK